MFDDLRRRTLVVLSHPNHEAAIFGLMQRLRPAVVILTDGGGAQRVAQSRHGLERIGLLERTTFLGWREADFYAALLARDLAFLRGVALQVGAAIAAHEPEQILCDAVEFYNPVHDLSLPIVRAALGARDAIAVLEVPLVYQRPGIPECYAIQRFPARGRAGQRVLHLTADEYAHKLWARDEGYASLRQQLGPLLSELPAQHLATEVVAPATAALPVPGDEYVLRYEWRGRLLLERGEVQEVITYAGHYVPLASSLLA